MLTEILDLCAPIERQGILIDHLVVHPDLYLRMRMSAPLVIDHADHPRFCGIPLVLSHEVSAMQVRAVGENGQVNEGRLSLQGAIFAS